MKKNKYVMPLLLLLVVTISVGYAALNTTLNINGTSKITKQTWKVYFDTVTPTSGSVTPASGGAATIDAAKTTISYSVALTKPGDFYEFSAVVKNAGTLPAKISAAPSVSGVSSAQDAYVNYTVKWSDNSAVAAGNTIAAGASKTVKVRVEYDKNITASQLPTADQTLNLKFSMNFVQG